MIKPLFDRVIVRRSESAKKVGRLHIPEAIAEVANSGVVVAVGEGRLLADGTLASLLIKEGDTVLFGKFAGTEVEIGGETVLVMREDEIFGILE